jgi:hypothetical protein
MLPPQDNPYTADLPVTGAGAWPAVSIWDAERHDVLHLPLPWYTIFLGSGPFNFPQAQLSGYTGYLEFERLAQSDQCVFDETGLYCAVPPSGEGGFLASEQFFGLTVGDLPAVVTHNGVAPNGPASWGVTWYDPNVDQAFAFRAYACGWDEPCGDQDVAARFGGSVMTPENRPAAEALAAFASTFVEVRLQGD